MGLEDSFLNGTYVHSQPYRRLRIQGHDGDFPYLAQVIDRAGIDPDSVYAEFHGLQGYLVIEMNVAYDGHVHFFFKKRDDLAGLFLG